jgi:hypothetical protein
MGTETSEDEYDAFEQLTKDLLKVGKKQLVGAVVREKATKKD